MTSRYAPPPAGLPANPSRDYAELSRVIRAEGLLKRRYGYYAVRISLNILAFAGGWVGFVYLGNSWWQLFLAAFFAVMFGQLSFIGHDAGHRQIFGNLRANNVVGIFHGGLVGLSYAWWIEQHNRHHANPNHEDNDPDLDIQVLAFTEGQGHAKRGLTRWIAKHQAPLFFPLLLLEGLSLHVSSVRAIFHEGLKARRVEACVLAGHFAAYFTAVFLVLSPLTAVVFIVVHQCLWGFYMGCSFAPGHKGMAILTQGHSLDFLRKQVVTSRNVRGGPWVDFVLGGLNYQIEHHLFPNMPQPNLRRAQPIVRDYCARLNIEYSECGFLRTYGHVLQHLHAVSAPLRAATR